jgi:ABC-2 type transport system permease protein
MKQNTNGSGTLQKKYNKNGRPVLFIALLCLLVAGVFLINFIAGRLDERYSLSYDLTANAAYEVGQDTKDLIGSLDKDIQVYVLANRSNFTANSYFIQTQRIMEQYAANSPHIKLDYVNYVSDPTFSSKFPDLDLAQGDVLVVCGDKIKQIQFSAMFNYSYNDSGDLYIVSSRAEEAMTSAIVNVLADKQVRVAVLTGNNVADMSAFTQLLTDNNYVVSSVNLATDALDGNYDLALLLAPQIDLSEDALAKLDAFLYNNGEYGKMLFYTADVSQEALPNLDAFLKEWGVTIGDGAVFETVENRTYQYQPFYPIADYKDETYKSKLLDSSMPVLMPLARPVQMLFGSQDNNVNTTLLEFAATSGIRPSDAGSDFSIDSAEKGPMPALVLASKMIYDNSGMVAHKSEILVSGSTTMLDSFCIQNTSLTNSAYLLNVFNTTFEVDNSVNIEPKSLAGGTLSISTGGASAIGIILAGVLPLLILVSGVVIWLVRRYK